MDYKKQNHANHKDKCKKPQSWLNNSEKLGQRQNGQQEFVRINNIWSTKLWVYLRHAHTHKTFCLGYKQYTFFSSTERTFIKIGHVLGHRECFSKF